MNIPRIQIQQGYSKIGLETTRGQYSIEQPRPEVTIRQEPGRLELSTEKSSLEIDSRKAWSALGMARFAEVTDRIAQNALRISYQNIGNIASDGDRMMQIQQKERAFGEIARDKVFQEFPIEICGDPGYDNVDITYTPSRLSTNYTPGPVTFNVKTSKPVVDYYPGKVNPYLIQKNYIFMSSTGQSLDAVV
ncbi:MULTISPECIES: DUF6470 family protein [Paenibacillus]|uniref:Uncharacterized protein n=1 Tax=Paenibacillus albilobatus TaxID=2716884 RepID=A0A919XKX6_9BACL|nr:MULTISPECIES: DUF6470 family protein [Paenibacillus]GIO33293.1 hypothetical protein J2TS6_44340 [Paenibacillus albilobatus]